jgi:CDP-diacylglycerol--glycerol-3-phosphate 3-phosphatidyltransferase
VLRIILSPVVAVFILYSEIPHNWLLAGIFFGIAAITDALDGHLARSQGIITNFGKLMDPIADKLLVISALICFVKVGMCSPWIVIIILAREFLVTSIRMVSVENGVVIPANVWGKVKTIIQIVAIVYVLVSRYFIYALKLILKPNMYEHNLSELLDPHLLLAGDVLLWLCAAATVISGLIYIYESRELMKDAGKK